MQKAVDVGHLGGGHAGDVPRCHREPLRRWGNKPLAGGTRQVSSREKQRGLTKGRDQGTRCSWKDGGRGCCGLRGGGHWFALWGGGGVVSMWQGGLKCKSEGPKIKMQNKCKNVQKMQMQKMQNNATYKGKNWSETKTAVQKGSNVFSSAFVAG